MYHKFIIKISSTIIAVIYHSLIIICLLMIKVSKVKKNKKIKKLN